jgi:hypothetical protein
LPQLNRCFRSPEQRNAESNGDRVRSINLTEMVTKEKRGHFWTD